jgi:hypothetical protein
MRKMLFELNGTAAVAEMLDDVVPATCDAIWDILPVEGMSIHANWSSREIMLHLEGDKVLRLPAEGPRRRGTTAPGDIIFYWRSPQMSRGRQLADSAQFQRELSEFAIFYGDPSGGGMAAEDPVRMGRESDLQTQTLFARFVDASPEFRRACEDIRHKGLQKLVVRRLEE